MISDDLKSNDIELNPLYYKIEYELSRLEDDGDPLGLEQGYNIDWISLDQDIDRLLSQGQNLQVLIWKLRAGLHVEGFSSLNKYLNLIYELILDFKNKEVLTDEENEVVGFYSSALSWLSTISFIGEIKNSKIYPEENFLIRKIFEIDKKQNNDFLLNNTISVINKSDKYFKEKDLPSFQNQIKGSLDLIEDIAEYVNEYSYGYILDCHLVKDTLGRLSSKIDSIYEFINVDEGVNQVNKNSFNGYKEEDAPIGDNLNIQSLRSREEVVLVLDKLLSYFSVYEPSHPAPILIRRVKKMIGMGFEAIIQELLPESEDSLLRHVGRNNVDRSGDYDQNNSI